MLWKLFECLFLLVNKLNSNLSIIFHCEIIKYRDVISTSIIRIIEKAFTWKIIHLDHLDDDKNLKYSYIFSFTYHMNEKDYIGLEVSLIDFKKISLIQVLLFLTFHLRIMFAFCTSYRYVCMWYFLSCYVYAIHFSTIQV